MWKDYNMKIKENTEILKTVKFNLTFCSEYFWSRNVSLEPYVGAFQYNVLNPMLCTNSKLYKIVYSQDDPCAFCKS